METAMTETSILRPGASGGDQSLARVVGKQETQGAALAKRAEAEVQARYVFALQRQRDISEVRLRILEHCKRPGFAERAEYGKPVGNKVIVGPSIRFVETALQAYGNVIPEATVTFDDEHKRIVSVSVTDLERNVTYREDAVVEKFVERRSPKDGDEVLSERKNSSGQTVYRIAATEDDFANKVAAAISKKIRNLGLRVLPADIVDEAMDECANTRQAGNNAKDPTETIKRMTSAFFQFRVTPKDIEEYLGHEVEKVVPKELDDLRRILTALKEGEATWQDFVGPIRAAKSAEATPATNPVRASLEEAKARSK